MWVRLESTTFVAQSVSSASSACGSGSNSTMLSISLPIEGVGPEATPEHHVTVLDKSWFYFTRMLDAGTMGGDAGELNRFVSTGATILGVLLIPMLFVMVEKVTGGSKKHAPAKAAAPPALATEHGHGGH